MGHDKKIHLFGVQFSSAFIRILDSFLACGFGLPQQKNNIEWNLIK